MLSKNNKQKQTNDTNVSINTFLSKKERHIYNIERDSQYAMLQQQLLTPKRYGDSITISMISHNSYIREEFHRNWPSLTIYDQQDEDHTPTPKNYKNIKNKLLSFKKFLTTKFNIKEGEIAYCHVICPSQTYPKYEDIIFNNTITECEKYFQNKEFVLQSCSTDGDNIDKGFLFIQKLFFQRLTQKLKVNKHYVEEHQSWLLKLFEDIIFLYREIYDRYKTSTLTNDSMMRIISAFIRLRTNKPTIQAIVESELFTKIKDTFLGLSTQSEDEFENETFDFINGVGSCRDFLDKFEMIKDSQLYKKLYKLSLYILSSSLFEKLGFTFSNMGYTVFEAEAIKKRHHLGANFILTLADTVIFLCERGFQIIKTGNFQHLYHSGSTYVEFFEIANKLKRQSHLLTNPEIHGFNESSFRAELDDNIEKGENIYKHSSKMSASEQRFVRNMVDDLLFIRCDLCTKRAAREHRKAPFSILLQGESNIGKSTITQIFYNQFARIKNLDSDPSFCYTRNPVANFWDGFVTSQWGLVLDDIAAIHPNKAPNGDPSLMELIQIINNVPFVPDQADLANKGRTPMKCKFVVATSNVKNLNAHNYFSHPSAVQRRLPFIITPIVKAEFATDDGSLDSNKTIFIDNKFPDYWHFKVEKVIPRKTTSNSKVANYEILLETDSIIDMLRWFNNAVKNFDENQDIVTESVNALRNIEICDNCFLPKDHCDCEIQTCDQVINDISFISKYFVRFMIAICSSFIFNFIDKLLYKYIWYQILKLNFWNFLSNKIKNNFTKQRIYNLGEKIKTSIGYPVVLGSIITIVGVAVTLSKYTNLFSKKQGGTSSTTGKAPDVTDDVRENVWYKNDFQLSSFDLTPNTLSSKNMTRDQFSLIVSKNLVFFRLFVETGKVRNSRAFCIVGQKYLTNNHNIPPFEGTRILEVISCNAKDGVNINLRIYISESQIVRDIENDILIITIPNLPPRKSILPYFTSEKLDIKTKGYYLYRESDGSLAYNNMNIIKRDNVKNLIISGFQGSLLYGTTATTTQLGDCGALLIGETVKGYILMGIHVLGSTFGKNVGAVHLTQEIIKKSLEEDMYTVQGGEPKISSQSAQRHVVSLHHKSVFRYLEQGTAAVHGSFTGFRPTHKSCVEISPMAHYLSQYGYKIKYGAPIMKGWEPWRIAAQDMVNPVIDIDHAIINKCVDTFSADILSQIPDLSGVHVYDDFTAINGAQGVAYVDKINRNTSAGNPWKKSKKYFMKSCPPKNGMDDPVDIDDEIKTNMDKIIDDYHNNKRAMPNFCAHLKDEAVSFKKIKMAKTRVFAGAPFDWSLIVRKYYLSAIRLIQNNRFIFESAPGTIAQSYEWTDTYNYITQFGVDRVVAGDYKAFDKRMSPVFILASFKILKNICIASGNFKSDDIKVLDGIAQDTAFPLMDFNGDLIQFYNSNPSGHPLTVIINGLCNSLYMRYAYYKLNPRKEVLSFKNNVSLLTYGDDNIMSVSNNIDWFTHTTIAEAFSKMGITYTMADKEAKSIPFINIKDASFLKRTWVYNEEIDAYLAPLDHDSIEKMLMVWTKSKSISYEEQAIAVISSAIREYFFYGKQTFRNKTAILKDLVRELDIEDWLHDGVFPSWSCLVDEFHSNTVRLKTKKLKA